ncbi:GNAT family N-acetyltransferase [Paenibacillus sp. LjRoot56]|uniref:GNAT family N-acetyltransferase n=1 Tax=Paenibacillus sp. LjRoot56 TaxID=3342333 RepID=UPI003ECDA55E
MSEIIIHEINDVTALQIAGMDCSPLPKDRDSIYLNFYRFFRDTCLVAVRNGEVIGFALGMVEQTSRLHAYLNYLFVKEEYRKTGIGKRLLEQFEMAASIKGCEFVTLLTGKQENIDYYQRQGYEKNNDLKQFSQNDAVYDYYYNIKKVSLLYKPLNQ